MSHDAVGRLMNAGLKNFGFCLTVSLLYHSTSVRGAEELGPAHQGLRTRLVALQDRYVVGQPMRVRIEVKNEGPAILNFFYKKDPFEENSSILRVVGPDGAPATYVADGPWEGDYSPGKTTPALIADGETIVLFDEVDLAAYYYINKPGRYQVQVVTFEPAGYQKKYPEAVVVPSSNVLELAIEPGELSRRDVVISELLPVLPKGWVVRQSSVLDSTASIPGVYARLCNHPYRGTGIVPVSVRCVTVDEVDKPFPTRKGLVYLGRNSRGYVYVSPTFSDKDFEAWSGASEVIAKALGATK